MKKAFLFCIQPLKSGNRHWCNATISSADLFHISSSLLIMSLSLFLVHVLSWNPCCVWLSCLFRALQYKTAFQCPIFHVRKVLRNIDFTFCGVTSAWVCLIFLVVRITLGRYIPERLLLSSVHHSVALITQCYSRVMPTSCSSWNLHSSV